jgi:hypothetical protein
MATFESDLADKFAPIYHASRNERNYLAQLEPKEEPRLALAHPPWRPYVYFSVLELGTHEGEQVFEINYLTIWDWDSGSVGGIGAHQWDTERAAILVAGPKDSHDLEEYTSRQVYYAAHEGVRIGPWGLDNSRYVQYARGRNSGPDVWWSGGKHASFPDRKALEASNAGDSYRAPGDIAKSGEYKLVDVGTLRKPSRAAPWITYRKGWGEDKISSVYGKLRDRLWDAAGNTLRRILKVTEDQIAEIQRTLDVPQTGQFDVATLQEVADVLPEDRVWTTQQMRPAEFEVMADRGFDVAELMVQQSGLEGALRAS